jgi:hypothetical protein
MKIDLALQVDISLQTQQSSANVLVSASPDHVSVNTNQLTIASSSGSHNLIVTPNTFKISSATTIFNVQQLNVTNTV